LLFLPVMTPSLTSTKPIKANDKANAQPKIYVFKIPRKLISSGDHPAGRLNDTVTFQPAKQNLRRRLLNGNGPQRWQP